MAAGEHHGTGGVNLAASLIQNLIGGTVKEPAPWGSARVYVACLSVDADIRGYKRTNYRRVKWEILPRGFVGLGPQDPQNYGVGEARKHLMNHSYEHSCALETPPEIRAKLMSTKFKHTYTPSFSKFDMAGLVYGLAGMVSYFSHRPNTSFSELVGKEPVLHVIARAEEVACLGCDVVYIPRCVSENDSQSVFWALVWAATLCGSMVLTDSVELSSASGDAVGTDMSGALAWRGAIEALGLLAALYDSAGAGDVFALAFFKGLHTVSTVVGHSDEGGLTRDALRRHGFAKPFGGLPPNSIRYGYLATIDRQAGYQGLVKWVDSYLLLSAAAVAHCDPLVNLGQGFSFPTVACPTSDSDTLSKKIEVGQCIAENFSLFARHLVRAWGKLLGMLTETPDERGHSVLMCAGDSILTSADSRHILAGATAPYFWVEPTGILPCDVFGTPAEANGWASLCGGSARRSMPFFKNPEAWRDGEREESHWTIDFMGPRQCGAVLLMAGNLDDGLGLMTPYEFDPRQIALAGFSPGFTPEMALDRELPLSEYLWTRGQSAIPHPAECLNTGVGMGIRIRHLEVVKGNKFRFARNIPSVHDIATTEVTLSCSGLIGVPCAKAGSESWSVSRARNSATDALREAIAAARAFGAAGVPRPPTAARVPPGRGPCATGKASLSSRVMRETEAGPSPPARGGLKQVEQTWPIQEPPKEVKMAAAPLILQHGPQSAPQAVKQPPGTGGITITPAGHTVSATVGARLATGDCGDTTTDGGSSSTGAAATS